MTLLVPLRASENRICFRSLLPVLREKARMRVISSTYVAQPPSAVARESQPRRLCHKKSPSPLPSPGLRLDFARRRPGEGDKSLTLKSAPGRKTALAAACLAIALLVATSAPAAEPRGFLETIHHHILLTSTVSDNGDLNPYALIVAPVSAGRIQQGDVLVDNFNNLSNLQGTGTTIIDFNPATKKTFTFAKLPQRIPQVPGGIGLTTAMVMLKSGWVIVGSLPSTDGTTRTSPMARCSSSIPVGSSSPPGPDQTSTGRGATLRRLITAPPRRCS